MSNAAPMSDEVSLDDILVEGEDVTTVEVGEEAPTAALAVSTPAPPTRSAVSSAPARPRLTETEQKLSTIPGVSVVPMGERVSRYPIDRIKFNMGRKSLIALISASPIVLRTHFDEGEGGLRSFLCFSGECCDVFGLPSVRYVFPLLQYDTNDKGQVLSENVTCKIMSVGEGTYEQLCDINTILQEGGLDVTKTDLLVTCTDETYQKVTFTQANKSRFRDFPKEKVHKEIQKWKDNMSVSYRPVARMITPDEFRKAKAMAPTSGAASSANADLDDLLA